MEMEKPSGVVWVGGMEGAGRPEMEVTGGAGGLEMEGAEGPELGGWRSRVNEIMERAEQPTNEGIKLTKLPRKPTQYD